MSDAAATYCPNCNGANPVGAKFCSACRATLAVASAAAGAGTGANPMPPPPPPPPRPGIGGMMGQMGGKAVTRQISGDSCAIYTMLASYVRSLPSTEIQSEVPPQQISAKVGYKDFASTGGIVIAVDTSISIAPTAPGQSQVSVTTKTDMSSTNKIWIYNLFFSVCGLVILPFPLSALILVILLIMSFWLMSTSPGQNVSNAVFEHLRNNAAKVAQAQPAQPQPGAGTPGPGAGTPGPGVGAPGPSAAATASAATSTAAAETPPPAAEPAKTAGGPEDEVFDRIKKLAELRDAGAISEADFEAKKTDLLSRI